MTDIYDETETYQTPLYDDYHQTAYDHEDEYDEDYPVDDYDYYDESQLEETIPHLATGKRRVVRLLLILLLVLLVAGVVIFGVLPYVQTLSHPTIPPLSPAVQT